jgi:hypothetical protein
MDVFSVDDAQIIAPTQRRVTLFLFTCRGTNRFEFSRGSMQEKVGLALPMI